MGKLRPVGDWIAGRYEVFAVHLGCARLAQPKRPSHPAPHVRDDRDTPLRQVRDGTEHTPEVTSDKANYF